MKIIRDHTPISVDDVNKARAENPNKGLMGAKRIAQTEKLLSELKDLQYKKYLGPEHEYRRRFDALIDILMRGLN